MCQWLFVATGLCPWLLNIVAKDVLGLCASKQLCLCITQNGQELECYEGVWRCGDEECIHTHAHTITHKLAHTHIHTRARTLTTGASRPRKPEESADCEQCKDEERAAGH